MVKNKINLKNLLNSKWTLVKPVNKEKHFYITVMKYNKNDNILYCLIKSVISKRVQSINWLELKDSDYWIQGWR